MMNMNKEGQEYVLRMSERDLAMLICNLDLLRRNHVMDEYYLKELAIIRKKLDEARDDFGSV